MKDYTIIDFRKYNQQATKLLRYCWRKILLLYTKNFDYGGKSNAYEYFWRYTDSVCWDNTRCSM